MYKTRRGNKYGAKKSEFNGRKFDSKFEASGAQELELRKKAGEILDYDCQFKVEMWAYDENGKKALKKTHKIDFRVHEVDGTYTLLEYKGLETQDYKDRRKWLETFWLPLNLDHTYEVVYMRGSRWRK
jgi:hypothetical protein